MKRTLLALAAASALVLSGATAASAEDPQDPALSVADVEITYGEAATITATAAHAPADASIIFALDGTEIASVVIDNAGSAATTVPKTTHSAGEHTITATLVDTTDSSVVLAGTTASLIIEKATTHSVAWITRGEHFVTGKVSSEFLTIPTGTVSLTYSGEPLSSKELTEDGTFKADLPENVSEASARLLIANYPGDENHTSSEAKGTPVVPTSYPCFQPRPLAAFADIPVNHKFYTEIDWMHCMRYSTGWPQPNSKPLYKPADNLSRAAMAAFIFRMDGPKEYKAPKVSPFADVKPGDPFYKEIAWMHERKLSTGYKEATGKPTYRPTANLSREAMAAFIYRLEKPQNFKAPKVSPLADMKPGMKFYTEITWMYEAKLTTGNKTVTGKEYWPKSELSRQAMAAFIYRLVRVHRA